LTLGTCENNAGGLRVPPIPLPFLISHKDIRVIELYSQPDTGTSFQTHSRDRKRESSIY